MILSTGIADTSGVPLAFPVNTRFTTEGNWVENDGVFGQVFDDTRSLPLAEASVEILSAVDERMPGLPRVTPEMMGTLKTLGQIVDFLTAGDAVEPALAATPSPTESSSSELTGTL